MSKHATAENRPNVVGLQERRLDRTILRTFRTNVELDAVVPNGNQPRSGPKEDEELQRQIAANEGLFEPLLVEPHPELPGKFRIIDGDRRWTNSRLLVERGRQQYRQIPVEVTDRTLTEEERLGCCRCDPTNEFKVFPFLEPLSGC
jgi:ParB family chromosome partitioning protein